LTVDPGQLDAERFQDLLADARRALAEGEPGAAAERAEQALALWRGPALADFAYESFAQAEIARLDELRLCAQEERIEAELALGRHRQLVGELEALAAQHPLRERLRGQLMLALYRSDRQAEALQVYQQCRLTLAEELGLEPSQSLQRLERQILEQDPALAAPSAPPWPA
jgi:DNA-binding SARP family transcriptional activator